MSKALIVIDVQNVMFADSYELFNAYSVLGNIKALINRARENDIPIIYIQHTNRDDSEFSIGKKAWEIHEDIKPLETDIIIQKEHCDSFQDTSLDEKLKELGVETLYLVGMQTDYCVDTCCRRAYSLGYKNILVKDAHSTFPNGILTGEQIVNHHNATLASFALVKSTARIDF